MGNYSFNEQMPINARKRQDGFDVAAHSDPLIMQAMDVIFINNWRDLLR
jgi:hypothetical protein